MWKQLYVFYYSLFVMRIKCAPNAVLTGPCTTPTASLKTTLSNWGTICPCENFPRDPPLFLDGHAELAAAKLANSCCSSFGEALASFALSAKQVFSASGPLIRMWLAEALFLGPPVRKSKKPAFKALERKPLCIDEGSGEKAFDEATKRSMTRRRSCRCIRGGKKTTLGAVRGLYAREGTPRRTDRRRPPPPVRNMFTSQSPSPHIDRVIVVCYVPQRWDPGMRGSEARLPCSTALCSSWHCY